MKRLCELVNISTGQVNKTEKLSRYGMKHRNQHLARIDSPWRWREVGNEDSR